VGYKNETRGQKGPLVCTHVGNYFFDVV